MSVKELYRDDLLNRFASHSFVETAVGTSTKVEFKDGASALVDESTKPDVDDAYKTIRGRQVGGREFLPSITSTQRDALTSPKKGEAIFNQTNISIERYDGTNWVPTNEIIEGDFNIQGKLKIGGDTGNAPLGAIYVSGTDLDSGRIRTIVFGSGPNGAGAVQVGNSRGTEDSRTALNSGDRLGQFLFVGDNGTTEAANGPVIRGFTTEAWTGSARGSNIEISTVKDGTTAHNLALTISENGFPKVPSHVVASLPTAEAGGIIYVSDETGGATLAFSDGSAWRRVQDRAVVA